MDTAPRRPLHPARAAATLRRPRANGAVAPSTGSPSLAEELASLVGRTRRSLRAEVERRLAARGEPVLAWLLLKHLVRAGPARQVELAEATAQDPAAISRALEELEDAAAVRRARDPLDRRRLVAAITPRGVRRFQAMTPAVVEGVEEKLGALTAAEQLELRRILRKLLGD